MPRPPSRALLAALRSSANGRSLTFAGCLRQSLKHHRHLTTSTTPSREQTTVPFRKQLKDEAKARKHAQSSSSSSSPNTTSTSKQDIDPTLLSQYELTIGLEIHAELYTARKLFSPASTSSSTSSSFSASPNSHVSAFDAALPGAMPQFQKATLLPAIRAALALGCEIRQRSGWDRKHYFWWDQPNGYQITQYYEPFATTGHLTLTPTDLPSLPSPLSIGIKQIQLEQDTAKTILQPPHTHLLDFNRVSHPLIEIISLPQLHSPEAAAAFVKKVQGILKAVGACETGMEMGGLRCDVNVSVRPRAPQPGAPGADLSYAGVHGLGQRTEIKNLSSLAAISLAITAERNRQIHLLESGGRVEGETRGWTLGASETHRLRGKEGEVDYRYVPDPDLGPLVIGRDLVEYLRETLPEVPEETVGRLVGEFGVSGKDAVTLVDMEGGERVEYYLEVVERLRDKEREEPFGEMGEQGLGRVVANWVVHELGALLTISEKAFDPQVVTAEQLADILTLLLRGHITLPTAKSLLALGLNEKLGNDVEAYVDANRLRLEAMSDTEYTDLAAEVISQNEKMAEIARKEAAQSSKSGNEEESKKKEKKPSGKLMYFVGQMIRQGGKGKVQPQRAEETVREVLLR